MLVYVGGIRWNKILEWLLCTLSCDDHYYSLVVGELPSRVMQKCPGTQIQMMVACLCPITRNERDSLAYGFHGTSDTGLVKCKDSKLLNCQGIGKLI